MKLNESILKNLNESKVKYTEKDYDEWWKNNYKRAIYFTQIMDDESLADMFYDGDFDAYSCETAKSIGVNAMYQLGLKEFEELLDDYEVPKEDDIEEKENGEIIIESASNLNEAEKERHLIDVLDPESRPERFKNTGELMDYDKTNPYGFVSNSASLCPKCNAPLGITYGYNMKHRGMTFDDDGWLSIPWKCRKCGTEGIAIFQTEYWSQGVFTKNGMVEVRNCGIEPKW